MKKNITITVYQEEGEKYFTDSMTLEEAKAWVKKWMKKGDVYAAYNHDTNEDISYNFLNRRA